MSYGQIIWLINNKQVNYNIEFFTITGVFLGNRMSNIKRREIIEICKERNIPYIGVKRNANVFWMSDCEIKCEDCYRYNKRKYIDSEHSTYGIKIL